MSDLTQIVNEITQNIELTEKKVMPRGSQFVRIFRIVELLQNNRHGMSIKQIHSKLKDMGFTEDDRTVRRDLETIEKSLGIKLEISSGHDENDIKSRRYKIQKDVQIGMSLSLSMGELFSLYLARGVLSPLKDTAFYDDLNTFFSKIDGLLSEEERKFLGEIKDEMRFEPTPNWGLGVDPQNLDAIRSACANAQTLQFTYDSISSQEKTLRKVGPHIIYFAKGSLYLLAEDLSDKKIKTFSLPRITDAEMCPEPYDGQKVDPEKYFSDSFGVFHTEKPVRVKLKFAATVAGYVRERKWHASQKVVRSSDGTIEMHLNVGLTPDLIQWIMGFNSTVEVLEPKELKEKILESAKLVVALYEEKLRKVS